MITPTILLTVESEMLRVSDQSFRGKLANQFTWWNKVAAFRQTKSRRTILTWILESARLTRQNDGEFTSQDMYALQDEYTVQFSGQGLKISKTDFDDDDTSPMAYHMANEWATQMGAQFAYWPQKLTADFIKNAQSDATILAYDNLQYFHTAHLNNPLVASFGTYANLFTGAASGAYPGALPISGVTLDVAFQNLCKLITYVSGMKSPNGRDPRGLVIKGLVVPPALYPIALQLTSAEYIAQQATGGGAATADVRALKKLFAGFGEPICAPELGASFGGSDTDYYVILDYADAGITTLGAFAYIEREAHTIKFHGPQTDAELERINEFQWNARGRNGMAPGHPYMFLKCRAT